MLLFSKATEILGEITPDWLSYSPEREPANRSLATMWYRETGADDGLLYERDPTKWRVG